MRVLSPQEANARPPTGIQGSSSSNQLQIPQQTPSFNNGHVPAFNNLSHHQIQQETPVNQPNINAINGWYVDQIPSSSHSQHVQSEQQQISLSRGLSNFYSRPKHHLDSNQVSNLSRMPEAQVFIGYIINLYKYFLNI